MNYAAWLSLSALAVLLAAAPNAAAQAVNQILSVSPGSAAQGASGLTVSFTLDTDAPPAPPAGNMPTNVTLGSLSGTSFGHAISNIVTAVFSVPLGEVVGAKDATVSFPGPVGSITFSKSACFTVTAFVASAPMVTNHPQSRSVQAGSTVGFSVAASGTAPLSFRWQKNQANLVNGTNVSLSVGPVALEDAGSYRCLVTNIYGAATSDVAVLTVFTNVASLASDTAAASAYDAGWTNGVNGGTGFGAWQISAGGSGGTFTGSSEGNAGGASGHIDTSGRSWGLWSATGVTEAVRSLSGGNLTTSEIFAVALDNGYIATGRSIGFALQNSTGATLWEFYFNGGDSAYTVQDQTGTRSSGVPFTGHGMTIQFQPKGSGSYLALVTIATNTYALIGSVITQVEQEVSRFRCWNYEAGSGGDYDLFANSLSVSLGTLTYTAPGGLYPVVDTGQTSCYNNTTSVTAPAAGQGFYGQDAQCAGPAPSYTLSGDGLTVYDNVTGLTWVRSPDTSGDGNITGSDKLSYTNALLRPTALNAVSYGGYNDWRLPTIKEQYSLMDFRGTDPSGLAGNDTTGLIPYLNTNYFTFAYGNTNEGDRIIDSQYASSSLYVSTADEALLFGVNFADGRIKGYGLSVMGSDKTFFVQCVRGNAAYGVNQFVDNGDQTITDRGTGLMWTKADSGVGLSWSNALSWVQAMNAVNYLGHGDWRLPNVKELQSIVDYTRSPDTTASAAIDPVFSCTQITNEEYQIDYPWYWSGTTHATYTGSANSGCYVCFGRGMGYMNSTWRDVHGAGCQRSDPKGGLTNYTQLDNGYYNSLAPQGDAVRVYNYVRLVRDYPANADSVGDGIPDWWRARYFGGSGMTTNSQSCAACDVDNDGLTTWDEYAADTNPTNDASRFAFVGMSSTQLQWIGGTGVAQIVEARSDLMNTTESWSALFTNLPPTAVTNTLATGSNFCYRVKAVR